MAKIIAVRHTNVDARTRLISAPVKLSDAANQKLGATFKKLSNQIKEKYTVNLTGI